MTFKRRLTAICIVIICLVTCALCLASCGRKKIARVIILAGQSNCEGVSRNAELKKRIDADTYAMYEKGFDRIMLIRPSTNIHINEFIPVRLGMGTDDVSFGLELGMAEYLSEKFPNEEFYFVKHVHGGTPIDMWRGDGPLWDSQINYYSMLVDDVNTAISLLESEGKEVVIEAFCWMQGESDAPDFERVQVYRAMLSGMIEDFRSTFGSYNSQKIRFVDGGINDDDFTSPYYYKELNAEKKAYCDSDDYNFYIDTIAMGLTKNLEPAINPDIMHYDSLSMLKLGREFAKYVLPNA